MIPNHNFGLPPGVWTDDTSMTLCLARSLARSADGFSERDQLQAYLAWSQQGELSAIGQCFDIGGATSHALSMFQAHQSQTTEEILRMIKTNMDGDMFGGNGSLMRVLPIGLAYWRDENQARAYAGRSSCTTHPNSLCVEACEVWTTAIVKIMQATAGKNELSKLDILGHFILYPYSSSKLRQALTIPTSVIPLPEGVNPTEKESYYWLHHPLLQRIAAVNKQDMSAATPGFSYPMPFAKDVPSTGYVLHSLVAALYCFISTQTFEEGALMAVNMGSDADTVGAIYGGLAGVWYAETERSNRFWSPKVLEWKDALVERGLVEQVADELVAFSESLMEKS
ncbi:ADP-ribosylglycohydrolase [Macrolepiota fuliginosa MF-IS2]|uniref:ADP-ribosylhydrolase ARH3 n=1 Tax=Macrolepiota fuliginosa MF-IS2 TaxID=1400762 RepID=A0A9P6C2R5_9AGAR|nr:ADP-ribosylglycohydrolase [Macrolepiota fuliginosa MF-IS2]